MKVKVFILGIIIFIFGMVFYTYWYFEYKYILPTPIPKDYVAIPVHAKIEVEAFLKRNSQKPTFFHFFNPYCPCSRFNLDHFRGLVQNYSNQVEFYAVIGSDELFNKTKKLLDKYKIFIPIIVDNQEKLAQKCGVYSTPQAVLLDAENKLYYRGNYNSARFCTNPATDFARLSLEAIINRVPPPRFGELSTRSYGCKYDSSAFSPGFLLKIP
ncbi:MAG: redoxin domain-containing protein [Microscillaceae bacterium]|nr:redoxin domain-containing protein [Microscillaceae bacterium]